MTKPVSGALISIWAMRDLVRSTSAWAWSRWRVSEAILDLSEAGAVDGGLLHAELLLRQAQIDAAFLALELLTISALEASSLAFSTAYLAVGIAAGPARR